MPLLNEALEDFKIRWNVHKICRNKVAGCPHGVPDDLYHLPQLNGNIQILTHFLVATFYMCKIIQTTIRSFYLGTLLFRTCLQTRSFLS